MNTCRIFASPNCPFKCPVDLMLCEQKRFLQAFQKPTLSFIHKWLYRLSFHSKLAVSAVSLIVFLYWYLHRKRVAFISLPQGLPAVFQIWVASIHFCLRSSSSGVHQYLWQEAQLLPRDRVMRLVSSNLANYHATVQKLLIRQVLTKPMVWSWGFTWRQCVINKPTTVELCISPVYRRLAVAK